MATKRKKKRKTRAAAAGESGISQATYTLRRDSRIANLYFVHRLTQPPVIYDTLLTICRECGEREQRHYELIDEKPIFGCASFVPLISSNRSSGLRTIEAVVKHIREHAEPEEILRLRRPIETEKVRRTYEHLLQLELEVIEDRSHVKHQKLSPNGNIITVLEPRYSEQDKARAKKNAKELNEKLGRLEGAVLVAVDEPSHGLPGDPADDGRQQGFSFVFPNVNGDATNIDDMVAMNLGRVKVN